MSDQQKSQVKVIGFDLDNTLYPSTPEIQKRIRPKIYEKISSEFDISYEQAKELFETKYVRLYSGSKTIKSIAEQLIKPHPKIDIIQESIEEADILGLIKKNPQLVEMLLRLSKKKRLFLITGSSRKMTIEKLNKLSIGLFIFEKRFTHEDGSKSSGEVYKKWIKSTQLLPEQHLYVGDNKNQDIDVPKSLGIRTCILGKCGRADFEINDILKLENLF